MPRVTPFLLTINIWCHIIIKKNKRGDENVICKHPLKGFIVGEDDGKKVIKIAAYSADHMEQHGERYIATPEQTISPYASKVFYDFIDVPCKKCMSCRLNYAKMWSDRCMMEASYHDSNYFITLTYSPECLPTHSILDNETGELLEFHSLVKRDWQLFMKRLRKAYDKLYSNSKLRFFMCGEYGETTFRPHYHAIIFGLHLQDLQFYKTNSNGDKLYFSPWLDKIWGKGFVTVGEVTEQSTNYVARYITKKQYGHDADWFKDFDMQKEFTLMSRKPGIGRQFYEDRKDSLYDYDYISLSTPSGGINVFPPKYFDRLLEDDNPEQFQKRTEWKEKFCASDKILKCEKSSKPYNELLVDEETHLSNRTRILKRGSV